MISPLFHTIRSRPALEGPCFDQASIGKTTTPFRWAGLRLVNLSSHSVSEGTTRRGAGRISFDLGMLACRPPICFQTRQPTRNKSRISPKRLRIKIKFLDLSAHLCWRLLRGRHPRGGEKLRRRLDPGPLLSDLLERQINIRLLQSALQPKSRGASSEQVSFGPYLCSVSQGGGCSSPPVHLDMGCYGPLKSMCPLLPSKIKKRFPVFQNCCASQSLVYA